MKIKEGFAVLKKSFRSEIEICRFFKINHLFYYFRCKFCVNFYWKCSFAITRHTEFRENIDFWDWFQQNPMKQTVRLNFWLWVVHVRPSGYLLILPYQFLWFLLHTCTRMLDIYRQVLFLIVVRLYIKIITSTGW